MYMEGGFINVREMERMAVCWHSLPEHLRQNIKTFQLIFPAEREKKTKIAEEENGLEPERVHTRHLDLQLTP